MLVKVELYLELSQASMVELFYKNSSSLLAIFAKNVIIDVPLGSKYASEETEVFKMKLKVSQNIAIVTTRSVSCLV